MYGKIGKRQLKNVAVTEYSRACVCVCVSVRMLIHYKGIKVGSRV